MEINYLNLKRMYNYVLENVPEEKINMMDFRHGDLYSHKCQTVGCVIGHCTILDKWENIPKTKNGEIYFEKWSENFTGLDFISNNWNWCFGPRWPNNKKQILLRIKYLIDNQEVPKNWDYYLKLPVTKLEPYKI